MAKTTEMASGDRDLAALLKRHNIDPAVADLPVPDVGTLVKDEKNPFDWTGDAVRDLGQEDFEFARAVDEKEATGLEARGYRKVPTGAEMRGVKGGIAMVRQKAFRVAELRADQEMRRSMMAPKQFAQIQGGGRSEEESIFLERENVTEGRRVEIAPPSRPKAQPAGVPA